MNAFVFAVCIGCAGLMGYAIHRGATCTVAAVDELVTQRQWTRLSAMVEASLWVLGGLLMAAMFQAMPRLPPAYEITGMTLSGGALLGLGAMINRGCVFGTLARLGSGERAYIMTPVGFLFGAILFHRAGWMSSPKLGLSQSTVPSSLLLSVLVLAAVASRIVAVFRHPSPADLSRAKRLAHKLWLPRHATLVIGATFMAMFMLAGPWAYTDVLAELAASVSGTKASMSPAVLDRLILTAALFAGALFGGLTSGRYQTVPANLSRLMRCFCGGALMGLGSALIPGGNDGLVLMGLPLLLPYAWVAFLTMASVIALAMTGRKRWPQVLGWL